MLERKSYREQRKLIPTLLVACILTIIIGIVICVDIDIFFTQIEEQPIAIISAFGTVTVITSSDITVTTRTDIVSDENGTTMKSDIISMKKNTGKQWIIVLLINQSKFVDQPKIFDCQKQQKLCP